MRIDIEVTDEAWTAREKEGNEEFHRGRVRQGQGEGVKEKEKERKR